jgi:O-antigen biosynthesis protein WbqP
MTRFFDLFFAVFALVILSPVILLVFVLNWSQTCAPLFRQERLGQDQALFGLVKFRSMRLGTASVGTHLVDASAVTSFGRFLRRSKIDELPQLWNVLRGEMSLVGPRPGLPNQPQLTEAREKLGIFKVRPGITGLAQINGIDMSTPELLAQTDAQMIAEMSVRNYFKYIFLTVLGKGRGDRVKS